MALNFSYLVLKLKSSSVPPVIRGAKAMIEKLNEEENKIKNLTTKTVSNPIKYIKEDMSDIIRKHAIKDYKEDLYVFIKTNHPTD